LRNLLKPNARDVHGAARMTAASLAMFLVLSGCDTDEVAARAILLPPPARAWREGGTEVREPVSRHASPAESPQPRAARATWNTVRDRGLGGAGRVEMRLAVIYPLDGALAAFEAVEAAFPKSEVTLRQACRVVRRRERTGTPAHVDADPGGA
jgi:hypothetical protein